MSNIGKNKTDFLRQNDSRNFLFLSVVDVIKIKDFDYILIENVPQFLKMKYFYDGKLLELTDYLSAMFSDKYDIKVNVFNAKYFGIPQSRPRAIVRMYKKHLTWNEPKEQREITLKEAIGHLPSLESGEISNLKHHKARVHKESHIECMRYTPTGKSAFENIVYFPKKENGERVKGFKSSYKRMKWEQPAPTITIRSDAISSQ
ncbi:DNA cytosine methyltransferase, partial [Campylobacter sp. RM12642]|nr:DNA cytosine methyltransferase [Campylobacter sp. RM12642]